MVFQASLSFAPFPFGFVKKLLSKGMLSSFFFLNLQRHIDAYF